MIKITDEQRAYLEPLIPGLSALIQTKPYEDDFWDALDDLIMDELDDAQNELSPKGVKLQLLYDEIFYQNE